jgi:spermidine/putrescine transport system permease protein
MRGRTLIAEVPIIVWLVALVGAPMLLMVLYSFWQSPNGITVHDWWLGNYSNVVGSPTYRVLLWRTVYTAMASALAATLVAYPMAYFVSRRLRKRKLVAIMLLIIPLWVSMLLRIFAWTVILGDHGFLNSALINLGLIDHPSSAFLYTRISVLLTLMYVAIPFVFVTSYAAVERVPPSLVEASQDSGANAWKSFRNVIWPLTKQSVAIGFALALLIAVGDYVTPQLVGGINGTMLGSIIASQFGLVGDWTLGAAMACVLLIAVLAILAIVVRLAHVEGTLDSEADSGAQPRPWRRSGFGAKVLSILSWVLFVLPYLFLYLPLLVIVLFSFNNSESESLPLAGFTLRWYRSLWSDSAILGALKETLLVGAGAVAIGVVLGTYFALIFARRSGRGTLIVQTALTLPVLLPGIVLGISLAITFRVGGIQPGTFAVIIGHATFVVPVMMLIILARLRRLDPSLAQASMDCGAGPVRTFWFVLLPQIRTALVGAALLGFTLSFDEVIVTYFLIGNTPTLPVYIWNQIRFGFTPEVNAIFSLIGVSSLVIVLLAGHILKSDLFGIRGRDGSASSTDSDFEHSSDNSGVGQLTHA